MSGEFKIGPTDLGGGTSQRRCACIVLLDTSLSMRGQPIQMVNTGLSILRKELELDNVAQLAVDLAVITFGNGGVQCVQDWTPVAGFNPPPLAPGGNTPLGAALHLAMDMIEDRKRHYRASGLTYYVPYLWILTDGAPDHNTEWITGSKRVKDAKKLFAYALSTDTRPEVMKKLTEITSRVFELHNMAYTEAFEWLTFSLTRVTNAGEGDNGQFDTPPSQIKLSDVITAGG